MVAQLRLDPRRWKYPKSTLKTEWWHTLKELALSSRKEFQAEVGSVILTKEKKDDGLKES